MALRSLRMWSRMATWPSHPILRCTRPRERKLCVHRTPCTRMLTAALVLTTKRKDSLMPANRWPDRQNADHLISSGEVRFRHRLQGGWTLKTWCWVNGASHHALYDLFTRKVQNRQPLEKVDSGCLDLTCGAGMRHDGLASHGDECSRIRCGGSCNPFCEH